MRDDICTIPVSEVFEEADGCPICRMHDRVEERLLDYIMGPAMMEPDVRQTTNEAGFCPRHLEKMMGRRGRLSLALMLETHLQHIREDIVAKQGLFSNPAKKGSQAAAVADDCFLCRKINWGTERMLATVCRLYAEEGDFRRLFDMQRTFCLPHYAALLRAADKKQMGKFYADFERTLSAAVSEELEALLSDMRKYCSMYDYRNSGEKADWGDARDAVERAIGFLTSEKPE